MVRGVRSKGWWHTYRSYLSSADADILGLEADARLLRKRDGSLFPAVLQLEARAIETVTVPGRELLGVEPARWTNTGGLKTTEESPWMTVCSGMPTRHADQASPLLGVVVPFRATLRTSRYRAGWMGASCKVYRSPTCGGRRREGAPMQVGGR